jgi:hypothetical protein
MYLLDTNVLSEMRKDSGKRLGRVQIDPRVQAWIGSVPEGDLFLSVISILEVETGYLRLKRRDPRQANVLELWLRQQVLPAFTGRILGIDLAIARRCAGLHIPNPMEHRDAFIAATALVHGLTVVTRNVRHFEQTGALTLNPWESQQRTPADLLR